MQDFGLGISVEQATCKRDISRISKKQGLKLGIGLNWLRIDFISWGGGGVLYLVTSMRTNLLSNF
jgi:hypothetical protein